LISLFLCYNEWTSLYSQRGILHTLKRVWCLYRVSTTKQVDKDNDIPMQKNACYRYVSERPDWKITNELYEKGVSGWKLNASERDEMQIIVNAAQEKKFDVLLVYKSDRLGRKEDDTPILISLLVKAGIEVWSTVEGQSKAENHLDKLINYLTFWQASGESQNTSIRVKEKIAQMNEQSLYTGSNPPYGYEVYDTGEKHSKYDKTIKDMRIHNEEKKVVELIFDLYTNKGYGTPRVVQYLNEHGYKTRKGNDWRINTVFSILKNPIYTGKKRYNTKDKENHRKNVDSSEWKFSPVREDWIIIDENIFFASQSLMDNRRSGQKKPMPRKGKLLLNGLAYCGYCNQKLYSDMGSSSYKLKDGTVKKREINRYRCLKARQSTIEHERNIFTDTKYEEQFEDELNEEIGLLKERLEFSDSSITRKGKETSLKNDELKMLEKQVKEKESELDDLNGEVIKAIRGKSSFKPEQLSKVIEVVEQELEDIKKKYQLVKNELESLQQEAEQVVEIEDIIKNWKTRYAKADPNEKKMLIYKLVDKVHFYKGHIEIDFKFKVSL
jgi:site-specific DNA recombinase